MSHLKAVFEACPFWSEAVLVVRRLNELGFEAYLAGGCVRDALLGREFNDLDIATSASPDEVEAAFDKTISVGKNFGTIVVVTDSQKFEVTTFREDLDYQDGRHPTAVRFSGREEDAKRRDFTINALFYDVALDEVLDFVDGLKDLNQKLIRAVGDPNKRFSEDHLRVLRALRFQAQLGFQIEAQTWNSVKKYSTNVSTVSAERVLVELNKAFHANYFSDAVFNFNESGILNFVLPGLRLSLPNLNWGLVPRCHEAVWATLLFDKANKDRNLAYSLLRFSNFDRNAIEFIIETSQVSLESCELSFLRRINNSLYLGGLLRFLEFGFRTEHSEWLALLQKTKIEFPDFPKPLVNGQDLLGLGFSPGKKMGVVLDIVFNLQLNNKIQSQNEAIRMAKDLL